MAVVQDTDEGFGRATADDLDLLDAAHAKHEASLEAREAARSELGQVLYALLEKKGAQRPALAERLGCSGQTITNLAYGRAPRNGGH